MITVFPAMGQTSSRGSESYQSKKNSRCDRMLEVLKSDTARNPNELLDDAKTTTSSGKTVSSSGATSYAGKTTVAVAPMICRPNKRSPGPDYVTRGSNQLQTMTSSSGSFMDVPLATMFTPADIYSYSRLIPAQGSFQYPYRSFVYSSSDKESFPSTGLSKDLGIPLTSESSSISSSLQFSCDRSSGTSLSSVGAQSTSAEATEKDREKPESAGETSKSQQNEEQITSVRNATPEVKEESSWSMSRKRSEPASEVLQIDDSKLPQKKRRLHRSVVAEMGSKNDTTSQSSLEFLGVSFGSSNLDETKSSVSFKDFEDLMQSVEYLKTVQQEYDQKRKELIECEQKLIVQNALVAHKKLNLDHKLRSLSHYQTEETLPTSKDLFQPEK